MWTSTAFGSVRLSCAGDFTDSHGLKGVEYTATATGVPLQRCGSGGVGDGVTVRAPDGQYTVWVAVADTGVKDAVPAGTIRRMRDSLRLMKVS